MEPSPRPEPRPRRGRRVVTAVIALVLLLSGTGYGLYRHFNGNLVTLEMPSDVQGSHSALDGLPAGVPLNIVVLGTDSREDSEDCKLGGACGAAKLDGDTNADVEMIVHIAADRASMGVVSIPRDTIVDLPACSGNGKTQEAHRGRVNGSLNRGVDCTLRTLHQLSGLPISHFMMVDFSGVVTLSEAIGGVDVCVDNDVYDTYSHLKLAKGKHTLKGVSALQFVRTRHGFGDGSDLGRTVAQHLFLSSLQRELESAGTLLNPSKVYRIAEAGTQALTVDKGLADVTTLAQLARTVGGIPASSTSFVTLPTQPDPDNPNTVIPAESATALFEKLAADQPLTSPASTPAASPSTSTTNSPAPTGDPATDGVVQVSSETTGCARVSTQKTVMVGQQTMTPTEAYRASPGIPDSEG